MSEYEVERRTRLDKFLVQIWPQLDRRAIRRMVKEDQVLINETPARKSGQYVNPGDVVEATPPQTEEEPKSLLPSPFSLNVVYEDEAVIVTDKPAGMMTHAKRRWEGETLAHQLRERYPDLAHVGGVERSGIIQRMETDVSGLVLAGRSEEIYRVLKREAKRQRIDRRYSVLVDGLLEGKDTIVAPIGNVKNTRRRRLKVAREGRPSRTHYRVLRTYRSGNRHYSLLDVQPESARLHQMRVHLSWLGHPVVGDTIYGSSRQPLLRGRLFMHLGRLSFVHPVTEEKIRIDSELPAELHSILQYLARPGR
ncbi:MAG: RluA family pseudouridine synthase [Anaerolineae bacterium]